MRLSRKPLALAVLLSVVGMVVADQQAITQSDIDAALQAQGQPIQPASEPLSINSQTISSTTTTGNVADANAVPIYNAQGEKIGLTSYNAYGATNTYGSDPNAVTSSTYGSSQGSQYQSAAYGTGARCYDGKYWVRILLRDGSSHECLSEFGESNPRVTVSLGDSARISSWRSGSAPVFNEYIDLGCHYADEELSLVMFNEATRQNCIKWIVPNWIEIAGQRTPVYQTAPPTPVPTFFRKLEPNSQPQQFLRGSRKAQYTPTLFAGGNANTTTTTTGTPQQYQTGYAQPNYNTGYNTGYNQYGTQTGYQQQQQYPNTGYNQYGAQQPGYNNQYATGTYTNGYGTAYTNGAYAPQNGQYGQQYGQYSTTYGNTGFGGTASIEPWGYPQEEYVTGPAVTQIGVPRFVGISRYGGVAQYRVISRSGDSSLNFDVEAWPIVNGVPVMTLADQGPKINYVGLGVGLGISLLVVGGALYWFLERRDQAKKLKNEQQVYHEQQEAARAANQAAPKSFYVGTRVSSGMADAV